MFTRVVLPWALFMLVIGGIAWITQYLPSWRERPTQPLQENLLPAKVLEFAEPITIWERTKNGDPTGYVKEFEAGVEGQADFLFHNVSDGVAELGLRKAGCDCARAEVYVSDRPWTGPPTLQQLRPNATLVPLPPGEIQSVEVPPGAYGFVRQSWKGRKREGGRLNLSLDLWMQPKGKAALRSSAQLYTPAIIVPPLQFFPNQESLGVISDQPARAEFWCWSTTRDEPELQISPKGADPCFVYHLRPLPPKERQALLQRLLKEEASTRIRSAFQVSVTVYSQKDGRQLDQGPFQRHLPLLLDGFSLEAPPMIMGLVRGDVDILGLDNVGKVSLPNFPASAGCTHKVALLAPADVELFTVGQQPSYLEVKLLRHQPEAGGRKTRWTLEVHVPPGRTAGPLPEDSAVILRTGATPPRFIRIPLIGNAVQG